MNENKLHFVTIYTLDITTLQLIDYEPRAHQQIPLLMALGEERVALHKAVESGNTDLVYTVILRLRESTTLWDFQVSNNILL